MASEPPAIRVEPEPQRPGQTGEGYAPTNIDDIEAERARLEMLEVKPTGQSHRGSIFSFFQGNEAARHATAHEQNMSFRYTIVHYWPAMM